MNVLVFTHDSARGHDTGPGHPERPARHDAVIAALRSIEDAWLVRREAPPATVEQILRVHRQAYVEATLAAMPNEGLVRLDPDTVVSPGSREAVLRAAGGAVAGVDAVLAGEASRAFAAMRPPGHHAESDKAMGFCLFDSVAVGAAHARAAHGIGRIAIVDFDVHHGNGTQEIFWDDPQTLYVSTHQWPLYPGTGAASERGAHGNVLNVPLPPGTDGEGFRQAVEAQVLPALERFRPELLFISAGFDAHRADPLANLALVEEDFAWITSELVAVAERHAQGRVVSVLEGGYDVDALETSVVAHLRALAGEERAKQEKTAR
ncbi:histone deacetylase family protein [Geminicoccus roseus]|uniref:histone deacetylase family protein n=1 Tax=Geminicoccus roseus TaxID=404900 RepID=UPI00041703A6|nr:histone deacetylase family protein [Geminicoccus roseus]